jgi:hypothetical protein
VVEQDAQGDEGHVFSGVLGWFLINENASISKRTGGCKASARDSDGGPLKKGLRFRGILPAALKLIAAGGFVADLAGFANLTR